MNQAERNIKGRIYDFSGDVVYEETFPLNRFLFMKLYNNAIKEGVDPEEVDIQQSIKQMNKEPELMIRSVMVVDDEPILREGYIDALTRLCHYVEAYESADNAYYAVKEEPSKFDTVLTDNVMPESTYSGSQLAKAIKEFNSEIKVHIVTGEVSSVDKDIFDYDVENTISKPLSEYTFSMIIGKGKVRTPKAA